MEHVRGNAELGGDAPHGQRIHAFVIRDRDRRCDDLEPRERSGPRLGPRTMVPTPRSTRTSRSRRSMPSTLAAVAKATPCSRTMSRAEGTGDPGASAPDRIFARRAAATRWDAVFCFTTGVLVHAVQFIDTRRARAHNERMRILISGSSIAGPALAFWLQRYGIDVTVVERAPALRPGGYFIDIRGVALDVVERMGLREPLRALEANTLSNTMIDERGRRFGRTARGFGVIDPNDIEVRRGDLARVLHDATRGDVEYRFGGSIAAIEQQPKGVDVTFAGGARETYDAVVGADGVHSRTRALAFGPEGDVRASDGDVHGGVLGPKPSRARSRTAPLHVAWTRREHQERRGQSTARPGFVLRMRDGSL